MLLTATTAPGPDPAGFDLRFGDAAVYAGVCHATLYRWHVRGFMTPAGRVYLAGTRRGKDFFTSRAAADDFLGVLRHNGEDAGDRAEAVRELAAAGKPTAAIARSVGLSAPTVRRLRLRLGLAPARIGADPAAVANLTTKGLRQGEVAARLCVSRTTVKKHQARLGLTGAAAAAKRSSGLSAVAAMAREGRTVDETCRATGLSPRCVCKYRRATGTAKRTGLPGVKRKVTPGELDRIAGSDDFKAVAAELGRSPESVSYYRRTHLKLPMLGQAESLARMNRAHEKARGAIAGAYGLPPETTPTEVSFLLALLAGPMTSAEAHEAVYGSEPGPGGPSRRHLRRLAGRGLAARVRVDSPGRVGCRFKYALTAAALDLIIAAPDGEGVA